MNISGDGCEKIFYIYSTYDNPMYWLTSDHFTIKSDEGDIESKGDLQAIRFRPFGHHAMLKKLTNKQKEQLDECIAEASILERLSSLASAYYIFVGIFSGIFRAFGPCTMPYIPLLFAWFFFFNFLFIFLSR
jgi:hypothetical protein